MTVQLRLCRQHGGRYVGLTYCRWADNYTRCPVCEMARRVKRTKAKEVKQVWIEQQEL